jgi:hypothetical protein
MKNTRLKIEPDSGEIGSKTLYNAVLNRQALLGSDCTLAMNDDSGQLSKHPGLGNSDLGRVYLSFIRVFNTAAKLLARSGLMPVKWPPGKSTTSIPPSTKLLQPISGSGPNFQASS